MYLNGGAGHFAPVGTQVPVGPLSVITDVDHDNDPDMLVARPGVSNLYLNDGHANLVEADFAEFPSSYGTKAIGIADFDGDGDSDVLLGNSRFDSQPDELYVNDGSGTFLNVSERVPVSVKKRTADLALGDVNGDGKMDAMLATEDDGEPERLLLNDGRPGFVVGPLPLTSHGALSVGLGDLDGDGDLDALFGTGENSPSVLFLGAGDGSFVNASGNLPLSSDKTVAIALGDVDHDGDLDVVFGNHGRTAQPQLVRLALNDGAGVFTLAPANLPAVSEATNDVALADLDADGDLDLVVANDGPNRLHLGGPQGMFTKDLQRLPAGNESSQEIAIADADGDGDLDLAIANHGVPQLFLSDGAGRFTEATQELSPNTPFTGDAVAFVDLDGDAELDLVFGQGAAPDLVLRNRRRQVAWRNAPRIGYVQTLELSGSSLASWLTSFSLGTSNLPLAPYGTLHLDPAGIFSSNAGLLDSSGKGKLRIPVPADGGLVGLTIYGQALIGAPYELSNLESLTFTNL